MSPPGPGHTGRDWAAAWIPFSVLVAGSRDSRWMVGVLFAVSLFSPRRQLEVVDKLWRTNISSESLFCLQTPTDRGLQPLMSKLQGAVSYHIWSVGSLGLAESGRPPTWRSKSLSPGQFPPVLQIRTLLIRYGSCFSILYESRSLPFQRGNVPKTELFIRYIFT